jgi:hypothetical protein
MLNNPSPRLVTSCPYKKKKNLLLSEDGKAHKLGKTKDDIKKKKQ